MSNDHLVVKNLSILFSQDYAVKNLSFSIKKGSTLALVGESGSGKSMTALAVTQLLPLAAKIDPGSEIIFDDVDLLTKSELQMRKIRGGKIATVFQEAITALNPVLTIGEQLDEVLKAQLQMNKKNRFKKALELLDEVGLQDPKSAYISYPHQLSGGMKQRAMIAIALAAEPELLIADEPTTALDVTIQAQVIDLLKRIQQSRSMSMLFITHDLGIVYQVADHIVVMRNGALIEEADKKAFFENPKQDYSKALFAAIPSFRMRELAVKHEQPNEAILSVDDLKIHFPIKKGIFKRTVGYVKAVDGVSLELYKGKTLALVGESGSGKTTTGLGLLNLQARTSGRVEYNGVDLSSLSSKKFNLYRKDLQIIFQDPYSSMDPRMIIQEIIEEGMVAQKMGNRASREKRVCELLELVGLDADYRLRYPHEFSGGQRQRICIARALAMEPKFIVCDEPTSALDVSVQMNILKLLVKLQNELGLTYLLITHDISVVAGIADEVAVMYQGKIVEFGSAKEVLTQPQHEYTKKLLSAVPVIDKKSEAYDEV